VINNIVSSPPEHKCGGDRTETFNVMPVEDANRLNEIGPARQIEVISYAIMALLKLYNSRDGRPLISALEVVR
jgi:hypothetical protein